MTKKKKNNPKLLYVLVPLVLAIWGMIFYQIYIAIKGEDYTPPSIPNNLYEDATEQVEQESYALLLDYADPFFGKGIKQINQQTRSTPNTSLSYNNPYNTGTKNNHAGRFNQPTSTQSKATPQDKSPKARLPNFPTIVYQGQQVMNGDTVALLKINNRYYPNARSGDMVSSVQIEAIFRDSLHVNFRGQAATILR
ncbi:MAG: hypothetical protein MK212_15175 [Saprospiraceae bacterium]|nr:hypothetical protein [Saprospiraceae bacterium]